MNEIDILKTVIEDLKNDNLILKQTLLQAQKEYSDKSVMTLRDHFAGLAMQTLPKNMYDMETLARMSYVMADAMLAERNKDEETN